MKSPTAQMPNVMCHFETISILKSKPSIFIIFCLYSLTSFCQVGSDAKSSNNNSDTSTFGLDYLFAGLGSNMGKFMPTIKIKGSNFLYTYEQNSYYGEKNKRVDTVCVKTFRQTSIDSILEIIKDLKDTAIKEYNFCIMSGGIHSLNIRNGIHTTSFILSNTFHYAALKIANILNEYVPEDKKLWANEKMIKDAEDCRAYLFKDVDKYKKKKRKSNKTKSKKVY